MLDANDAIYLLYHSMFGDTFYPVEEPCDYDIDSIVDANDAIYLLYHTMFGDTFYPLTPMPVLVAAENIQPISGPAEISSETYDMLFDNNNSTKLCTSNINEPIIVKFTSAQAIVSYSLVNANDDERYPERTPLRWRIYGSQDGENWNLIDSQCFARTDNTNYTERNFILETPVLYSYIKFEPIVLEQYQLSGLLFYTTEKYINS